MSSPREHRVSRLQLAAGAALAALCALFAIAAASGNVWGAFGSQTANHGNELRSAADWVAPVTSRSVVAKSAGGVPGYIRNGGTYHVYAQTTDTGNPASGVATVDAVSDGTVVPLSGGAFSAGHLSYGYRSSLQTLSGVPDGVYSYDVESADFAGNSRSDGDYTFTVDSAAPTASDVQATNRAGGILSRPELGDAVSRTFSEPIEPISVLAGWSGAATNVVVHIDNNVLSQAGQDALTVYNATNTAQLPLGTIRLGRTDYVGANRTFGASGTPSTMTLTGNAVQIVLGTASGTTTTAGGSGTLSWLPSSSATDRAGNAMSTTSRAEVGTADRDF